MSWYSITIEEVHKNVLLLQMLLINSALQESLCTSFLSILLLSGVVDNIYLSM